MNGDAQSRECGSELALLAASTSDDRASTGRVGSAGWRTEGCPCAAHQMSGALPSGAIMCVCGGGSPMSAIVLASGASFQTIV